MRNVNGSVCWLRRILSGKRDTRLWDGAIPDGWLPAPDLADLPAMPA
jgi:hypothetical protein